MDILEQIGGICKGVKGFLTPSVFEMNIWDFNFLYNTTSGKSENVKVEKLHSRTTMILRIHIDKSIGITEIRQYRY